MPSASGTRCRWIIDARLNPLAIRLLFVSRGLRAVDASSFPFTGGTGDGGGGSCRRDDLRPLTCQRRRAAVARAATPRLAERITEVHEGIVTQLRSSGTVIFLQLVAWGAARYGVNRGVVVGYRALGCWEAATFVFE